MLLTQKSLLPTPKNTDSCQLSLPHTIQQKINNTAKHAPTRHVKM